MTNDIQPRLKVAIIGGGPGGLGAAIELGKLPFVDWDLYEKKPQISETGGGISLQQHTWRMLELNGAAENINAKDFYRPADGQSGQTRNGRSGKLLAKRYHPDDALPHRLSCRMVRAKLQAALLKNVDQSRVHVAKKLVGVEQLPDQRIRISFEDGFVDEVDLLVGADGIRSFIRKFSFPEHAIRYNGQSAYRTIISKAKVEEINGIPWVPIFWNHVGGLYVFTCPLGGDDFEVTARIRRPGEGQDQVSWGQPFDFRRLLHEYDGFCLPIRQILRLAAEGDTQEFALFSGPRLEHVVSHGNIALIGDASHPLSGAFGAGAGFALEDVYALTKSLDWAWSRGKGLPDAISLFDSIRSPHYKGLYEVLDKFASANAKLVAEGLSIDQEIEERVKRMSEASEFWMYNYEVDKVVEEAIVEADKLESERRADEAAKTTDSSAGGETIASQEEPAKESGRIAEVDEKTQPVRPGNEDLGLPPANEVGAVSVEFEKIDIRPNRQVEVLASGA
ncbi:FAD/NAD(P)-binding domain-containing protein [Thozetella sp. PMI_491]|nr:FAD/NAD(P)-binding domain-containing protein [Thozetella sp. PMI_491]